MTGLRRVFLYPACCALLFTSCAKDTKDLPPLASDVNLKDPHAEALFAKAQSLDTAGEYRKASKLYDETARKFPYSPVAAQARFREGVLFEADGELLDAFESFQQVIQRYQSSPLYTEARKKQEVVAHAAADGLIRTNFLGIKSRLESKKIVEMLETVRDNAPFAPSAPKAQFTVGQVYENLDRREKDEAAIAAYQKVVDDYASSTYAPEAQYRIGHILLSSSKGGNQNQANLDRARHTFQDLLQSYPNSKRAADARLRVREIESRDLQRSFDIAEFYAKKGQTASAAFYYQEVVSKSGGGELHDRAARRLKALNPALN